MLKPVLKYWLGPTDLRQATVPAKVSWRVLQATIVRKMQDNVMHPLPDWVREKLTGNVAIVLGGQDQLFPAGESFTILEEWSRKQKDHKRKENPHATPSEIISAGRYFPNTKRVYEAVIDNWSHHVPATNAEKHGSIIVNIMKRMLHEQENESIGSETADRQIRQRLYY